MWYSKETGRLTVKRRARMTSKGQITIPHEVRRAMGVGPGDTVVFERTGGDFRVKAERTESRFEKFRGIGTPGISGGRKGIVRWVRKLRGQ